MDSRTMRLAVLLSMGALTLILLVVYAANKNARRPGGTEAASGLSGELEAQAGASVMQSDGAYLHRIGEGFRAYGEQIGNQSNAFMYDENFFDPMRDVVTGINDGSQMQLKLDAVPSGNGIHVSVTNARGGLEEGVAFQVALEQVQGGKETTWTDTDRDGQIDIPGLQNGSYRVRLISVPGYVMPDAPVVVKLDAPVQQTPAAGLGGTSAAGQAGSNIAGSGMSGGADPGVPAQTGQEVWDHAE